MENTIIGGKTEWKTTFKLMIMSYIWSLRIVLTFQWKPIEDGKTIPKKPTEFDSDDFKKLEKNTTTKKLLYFGLALDEYTHISECDSAKEIWNALRVAHEGTNQVKQSRIELLMRKYELF